MVVAAEQQSVDEIGGPALLPRGDVVGVGVCRRTAAAEEPAPAVAGGEKSALLRAEEALGASEVHDHAVGIEQQGCDVGVAGKASHAQRMQVREVVRGVPESSRNRTGR